MWIQIVNQKKKCVVLAIKNHYKLSEDMDLKGIPIKCCQIVFINNSDSIAPQIDSIKRFFNYLQKNMQYFLKI